MLQLNHQFFFTRQSFSCQKDLINTRVGKRRFFFLKVKLCKEETICDGYESMYGDTPVMLLHTVETGALQFSANFHVFQIKHNLKGCISVNKDIK